MDVNKLFERNVIFGGFNLVISFYFLWYVCIYIGIVFSVYEGICKLKVILWLEFLVFVIIIL